MAEMKIDITKSVEAMCKAFKADGYFVGKWIPCSERMPESSENVLVWFEYFRYGKYNCMYQTYNIGNYVANHDSWMVGHETGWRDLRVIAWMHLPEPPESEEVQEDA